MENSQCQGRWYGETPGVRGDAQRANWVVGNEAGEGGPGHAGTGSHSREFHLHPKNAEATGVS